LSDSICCRKEKSKIRYTSGVRIGAAILFIVLVAGATAKPAHAADYTISAVYTDRQIEGIERIAFTNDTDQPLAEILLFLYPNIHLEKDSRISGDNYRKSYPTRFNAGEMQIGTLTGPAGEPLSGTLEQHNGKPVLMKIPLPTPITPGASLSFEVRFTTKIPEKYGVFGHAFDRTTLQGGWYPHLVPRSPEGWDPTLSQPENRFRVRLVLPSDLQWLASAPSREIGRDGGYVTHEMEADGIDFFSLSIGRGLTHLEKEVGPVGIRYQYKQESKNDRRNAGQVVALASDAVRFFQLHVGPMGPTSVQMAASPLYQDITADGSGILFVNHHIFKVAPFLRHYHEAGLARAIFWQMYRAHLPNEETWVIDGLAPLLAERFMQVRPTKRADMGKWLSRLDFIPLADEILYSKALPLRQVYFKEASAPIFNEDIRYFHQLHVGGSSIFSKLGVLLGQEAMEEAVAQYLKQPASFRKTLEATSGRNFDSFLEMWLKGNPPLDFRIDRVGRWQVKGGKYQTEMIVAKDGEGIEPLEIQVRSKGGEKRRLIWEGDGTTHTERLLTDAPIDLIELDPDRRVSDPDRLNNRSPHQWKVLLQRFGLSGYNLNTGALDYKIGIRFKPTYSDRDKVTLGFEHDEIGNTGGIEYAHTFIDRHGIVTGVRYERPTKAEPLGQAPAPEEEDAAWVARVGYTFHYPGTPDVPLRFPRFSKLLQQWTGKEQTIAVFIGYNQQVTDEMESSMSVQVDLKKGVVFTADHEIIFRLRSGAAFGRLFENHRFALGGDDGMRGYSPLDFKGDAVALFSAEYRFPLLLETGWNLAGAALTHTLQGALFADAGQLSKPRALFDFDDVQSDMGVGLRWRLDALGFYPTLIRLDAAMPIHSPIEDASKWHFYLTAGQAF
jgi:hypothetical protein